MTPTLQKLLLALTSVLFAADLLQSVFYIREADRLMYEIKREVHAKDEEEQKKLKKQKA